jgi:hypothetical protein
MRYARKTGYRITFEDFQDQVAPVVKPEDELEDMEEEGDGEEVDPDAQPMERYEDEEFIGGGGENMERIGGRDAQVSGNEEEASEDDTQMKNRYEEVTDPRAAFFMQ